MANPIVFISRSRVKDGAADGWRAFLREGAPMIEASKPRTLAFLPYLADDGAVTIVHVFEDATALDAHLEGAGGRSAQAYDFIDPIGFELYGQLSEPALDMFRGLAGQGFALTLSPELPAGFLRVPDPAATP